ncbi:MAG: hypothetical protein ACOYT8_06550 [Candidatus Dependentiae bacterium]
MKKMLFLSLLLSFPLFGMEGFNLSGNARGKINPHANQVITQAFIKLNGNSQITVNSVNDLRIDLDGNATLSLPHPAKNTHLDDIPLINPLAVTNVNGSNQYVGQLNQNTQRLNINLSGNANLALPVTIQRVDIVGCGNASIILKNNIRQLDVKNLVGNANIKYSLLGSLFYRIKNSSLVAHLVTP